MASIAIGSIIKSGNRIKIRANLGGQLANILIDSGAACSCTDIPLPLTNETIPIQGIGDTIMIATKTQPVQLDLGVTVLEESLWYLPNNSEGTVLGMDIMRKYGFVIHCFEKQIELKTEKTVKQCLPKKITSVMSISTPDPIQQMVNKHDSIWATHEHDCGLIDFVVCIEGEPPPPQKQYRIKPEAESAVHEIVHQLETRGIVRRCSSTTNSPCLPVPKSNGKWRLCIDYQRLNKVLPKATPIVANPSTLLSQISTQATWFTVLDVKNGFWSIPIKRTDQWKLAFTVNQIQYTWERMPQGLHNSPAIFHRALEDTLNPLTGTGNVIHYVDDILIATEGSLDDHLLLVDEVLLTLGKAGFKLNKEKAQIAQTEVQYLGYTITQSYRALTDDRRKCIAELPRPHTLNSLQKVLGTANYLRDFIPDFANAVTPLYSLLKGKSKPSDVLEWTEEHDKAFMSLKENLCCAPALGLPNPKKSFHLQVDANENTLSGVLAQDHGGKLRPIAYYSRKKSTIEQGFDPCTQHVLAVHWMLTATEPIVGFQPIVVHTVHTPVQMLLQGRIKGVSSQRLARWLADIQARDITTVNDRILPHLLGDVEGHPHTCQTKQEAQSPVHDQELPNQTQVYIDGSRYWHDGKFHTGCAVWAPHSPNSDNNQLLIKLSGNTSAQEAELIALLEAIRSHHEPLCIYTDSRYAFGTVHDFMAQWQLRKFLTSAGTPIKHFNIITSIWQEIRTRDSSLSVVKVRAHIIKNPDENEKNNNIADQLAKLAAQKGDEWKPDRLVVPAVSAIQTIPIDLKQYQQELWSSDGELTPHLQQDQLVKVTEGMILRDDKYIVPEALQKPVIKLYHDYAHVSAPKTQQLIQKNFWWPQMASDIQRWCDTCIVCATINQGKPGRTKLCRPEPPKGPWELLQLDFIGPLPSAKGGYRYCLVIIDKFSKWVEAIPTRNNSANTVARVVANQILPLWGAPIQIESDQGTHFTGQVMKQICQMLNIKQRFHIPYRPQSSGMVERANRTIKESISKQVAQHKNQWIDALPTVLTILRATPSKATGISPFELMTGRVMKLPIDPEIAPADLGPLVVATQQSVLKQLRERLEVLHARAALKQQQSDLTNDTQFNPTSEVKFSEGDMVMVRVFVKQGAFTPRWHGPYEVKAICNSCVATTVKGKLRWYHMSQCKSFKSTKIQ